MSSAADVIDAWLGSRQPAVVFDFNGTLSDDEHILFDIFRELFRVHLGWAISYYIADFAMGVGIFKWYHAVDVNKATTIYDGFTAQAVMIGVWGRAALLVGLFIAFLNARSTVDDPVPADFLPGVPKPATVS